MEFSDAHFMTETLKEAEKALEKGEAPPRFPKIKKHFTTFTPRY